MNPESGSRSAPSTSGTSAGGTVQLQGVVGDAVSSLRAEWELLDAGVPLVHPTDLTVLQPSEQIPHKQATRAARRRTLRRQPHLTHDHTFKVMQQTHNMISAQIYTPHPLWPPPPRWRALLLRCSRMGRGGAAAGRGNTPLPHTVWSCATRLHTKSQNHDVSTDSISFSPQPQKSLRVINTMCVWNYLC